MGCHSYISVPSYGRLANNHRKYLDANYVYFVWKNHWLIDFSFILLSKERSISGGAILMEIYKYLNSWQIWKSNLNICNPRRSTVTCSENIYKILKEVRMSKFGVLSSGLRSQETVLDRYPSTCTTTSNGGPTSV